MSGSNVAVIEPPRRGSAAELALLFCDPGIRPAMLALHAYRRDIDNAILRPADPTVVRAKLAWWGEELERLSRSVPRHPITTSLVSRLSGDDVSRLAEYLLASRRWQQGEPATAEDFANFCDATGGNLAMLASAVAGTECATSKADLRAAARLLGSGIRATALIRLAVNSPLLQGRLTADDEDLTPLIEQSGRILRSGFELMPESERIRQRGLLVMAGLHARLPGRRCVASTDCFAEVGPIRKLWTAWRVARSLEYPR
jgi:phytoene synthase